MAEDRPADFPALAPGPSRPVPSRRLRVGLRAAFAAISFVTLVASGLAWSTYRNFTNNIPHGAPVPAGHSDPDGKDENILLIGNDSRAGASAAELRALSTGDPGGTVNTDTMMVLHIPANGSKPTVVSFPRDSWVDIPGNGKGKINAAYGDGYSAAKGAGKSERAAQSAGIIMTIRTITGLTGLHIDHYAQVNLLGFYRISNAIGGVRVCLNHAQNANTDSDQFGRGYSGINLPKGVSVIKGKQALAFVRQRHGLPNGDLDRIKRQQYFLAAAFAKVASAGVVLNPFKLQRLLKAVGRSLLTDPKLNVLSLAHQFEAMSAGGIKFATIPNDGPQLIYPDGNELSVVRVNRAAIPAFIRELQGKAADSALQAARPAPRASVTVDVLNGTDVRGLAGHNADQLKVLGFKVNVIDSTDATPRTAIQYPAGQESQAKALAAVVSGAKLIETATVPRVTLILGADGKQVQGLRSRSSSAHKPKASAHAKQPAAPANGLGCIN